MQGVPRQFEHRADSAQFRRPAHRQGVELYRAHIVQHAFEPHTHEAYGLGVIEHGVERFRYSGADHLAAPDSIVLMQPHELHTGRAETSDGWRYRMIYIDDLVLSDISGECRWWFSEVVVDGDRQRARRITRLLDVLWQTLDPLAFDSSLLELIAQLRPHARVAAGASDEKKVGFAAVIDFMRAHLAERLTLEDLAGVAGMSPFHFLRRFRAQHHATPQQMLMALRLFGAKQRLARGESCAQVAAATGLCDQAHLTRAFVRRYGVTPARYQRDVRT
jgi:AraC-like DNA-binding protein